MSKQLTTPIEVFQHIKAIYEQCDTLKEVANHIDMCHYYMCYAVEHCQVDSLKAKIQCKSIILDNKPQEGHWMTKHKLWLGYKAWLDDYELTLVQQKEYLTIKAKFLGELIEKLKNETSSLAVNL